MKKISILSCLCMIFVVILCGCATDLSEIPRASFTMDVDSGSAPLTVQFNSSRSGATGEGDLGYFWDFGDGNISRLENPSHTFYEAGVYNVKLTVTEYDGDKDNVTHEVTVYSESKNLMIINTSADSYFSQNDPDTNFGVTTFLQVSGDEYIYLKFSDIPTNQTITDAKVKLYTTHDVPDDVEIVLYTCLTDTWVEDEITWTNRPYYSIGVVDRILVNGTQGWHTWNVTSKINEVADDGILTVALVGSTSQEARFFSKDSGTEFLPVLELHI